MEDRAAQRPQHGPSRTAREGAVGAVGTITDLEQRVARLGDALNVEMAETFVSNHEGEIRDWIQTQTDELDGLLVNPAGLT